MTKWLVRASLVGVLTLGCGPGADEEAAPESAAAEMEEVDVAAGPSGRLLAVLAADHRSAEHAARDVHRHPAETLAFFGIDPDLSVVEIWPGGGYYTEILAPYLRESGRYYAAGFDPDAESEFAQRAVQRFRAKLSERPELYDRIVVTALAPGKEIAPAGSADAVLTFRNVHNWMAGGSAQDVFQAFYAVLKPGGVLGVVEHRLDPLAEQDPKAASGYVREDVVIELAEAAGFELVGRSEINANPADTKDYAEGVWTLPPTYRLEDMDREKYAGIGESDRMTLKFRKPAAGMGEGEMEASG